MPYRPVKLPDLWITLSDGKKLNLGGCILTFDPDVLDVEKARPAQSSLEQRVIVKMPIDDALREL